MNKLSKYGGQNLSPKFCLTKIVNKIFHLSFVKYVSKIYHLLLAKSKENFQNRMGRSYKIYK
jgi:hypothetical protein